MSSDDGSGISASFECGCFTSFQLEIDEERRVQKISFRSNGCGYMVAAAELLAKTVERHAMSDLHGLDQDALLVEVNRGLAGVSADRMACCVVPVEALRSAFANHRSRRIQ